MTEPPQPPTNDGSDDPDGDGIDEPVWARPDDAPEPSGETGAGDDLGDTIADAADGVDDTTDAADEATAGSGDAGPGEDAADYGTPVDESPSDELGSEPAERTIDATDGPEEPSAPSEDNGVVGEPTAIYPPVAPSFGSANDDVLWGAAAGDDAGSTTDTNDDDDAAAAGAVAASTAAEPHVEGDHTRQLRRVSHRRYVMRRAGAAVLALALIGGGIFGILQLTGDDEPTADDNRLGDSIPPDTEPIVIADPTTTVATTVAPTEPTTTTEAAVETEPAPLVPIEDPADTEAPDDDPPVDTEADEAPATEPDDEPAVETEPLAVTTTAETTSTSTTTPPTTTEEAVTTSPPPTSEPEAPVGPTGGSDSEPAGDDGSEPPAAGSEPADAESIFDDPRRPSGYELDSAPTCELSGGAGLGMAGSDVECIETRLDQVTIGPINFEVDRIFDEDTELAVMWFQYENCLVIDGIVGPQTAILLGIWPGSAPSADDDDEDAPEDTGEAPLDTEPECIPGVTNSLPGDSEPASTEP